MFSNLVSFSIFQLTIKRPERLLIRTIFTSNRHEHQNNISKSKLNVLLPFLTLRSVIFSSNLTSNLSHNTQKSSHNFLMCFLNSHPKETTFLDSVFCVPFSNCTFNIHTTHILFTKYHSACVPIMYRVLWCISKEMSHKLSLELGVYTLFHVF